MLKPLVTLVMIVKILIKLVIPQYFLSNHLVFLVISENKGFGTILYKKKKVGKEKKVMFDSLVDLSQKNIF